MLVNSLPKILENLHYFLTHRTNSPIPSQIDLNSNSTLTTKLLPQHSFGGREERGEGRGERGEGRGEKGEGIASCQI